MDDYLTHVVSDLTAKMRSAKTDECRLSWARKLVRAKHERGDYAGVLQAMPDWLAEALAEQMVRECGKSCS